MAKYSFSNAPLTSAKLTQFLVAAILGSLLTACGKSDNTASFVKAPPKTNVTAVTVSGTARADSGKLNTGTITVNDKSGKTVATAEIKAKGAYAVEIPAGTRYPILLTATPGAGEKQKEQLLVAIIEPLSNDHDITSTSTKIAKKAKSLGGYSRKNMLQAAIKTAAMPDGDKTVGGFRGDPTKQFGGWH